MERWHGALHTGLQAVAVGPGLALPSRASHQFLVMGKNDPLVLIMLRGT